MLMSIFINRICLIMRCGHTKITGCSSLHVTIDNEHTHVLLFYVFLQLMVFLSKKNYVNMTQNSLFKTGPMFRKLQHSFDCFNARLW